MEFLLQTLRGQGCRQTCPVKCIRLWNGWYRYDSRFALPVYNEQGTVDRYNVYHASMLIRHGKDGKYYLYDVLDIKKEMSNPF